MRKNFIDYYALVMLVLFVIYNFSGLNVYEIIYEIFMFSLITVNAIILMVFKKRIKYKTLAVVVYLLIWLFSKNTLQFFFAFSNIILLCITWLVGKHSVKIIPVFVVIFIYICSLPLFFIFLFIGLDGKSIYDDTHYYCDNNYEIYVYSAGAMDSFHYSIGKYYEILNINGIINISYKKQDEKTQDEYEEYLETHNCKLVGDINESK